MKQVARDYCGTKYENIKGRRCEISDIIIIKMKETKIANCEGEERKHLITYLHLR